MRALRITTIVVGAVVVVYFVLISFIPWMIVGIHFPFHGFTGYPPSVYMRPFLACLSDAPCVQTDKFNIDQVPTECCVLTVTNGDGQGTDEVRSYEVYLNGERVVATDHSRNAQAPVKLRPTNTLKVVLSGAPHSKVFVLLAYYPRRSK